MRENAKEMCAHLRFLIEIFDFLSAVIAIRLFRFNVFAFRFAMQFY